MAPGVAVVIRCADQTRALLPSLASVEAQTRRPDEVIVVADATTPERALGWLEALARTGRFALARSPSRAGGAARNRGVGASAAERVLCLDAGDLLDRSALERTLAALGASPDAAFALPWVELLGLTGGAASLVAPTRCDLAALVADPAAFHATALLRREAWAEAGGFDEALPALEGAELWLRILRRGGSGRIVPEVLLRRALRTDSLHRAELAPERRSAALEAIVGKHLAVFEADPAAALFARERAIAGTAPRYRAALARRDAVVAETDALRAEIERLSAALAQAGAHAVDWGELRRTTPISRDWGYERGKPIDRHYIERFLEAHAADIRGDVLEVQEDELTRRFGGERVHRRDVLDLDPGNPRATVVSDLRAAANVPSESYDCILLTQTLHVVDDMPRALAECARMLRPGGVLLATLPCASRVCLEYGRDGDLWRFTEAGARALFSAVFPEDALELRSYGNALTHAAFLYGLACHELDAAEFDAFDPYFPLLVGVRATRPREARGIAGAPADRSLARRRDPRLAAILLYHRVAEPRLDPHALCVAPARFREQMLRLREVAEPVALGELARRLIDGDPLGGAVAVTFDDGTLDHLSDASPILAELGVPATFFVTTDRLDAPHAFWWDELARALLEGDVPTRLELELGGVARRFATHSAAERRTAHDALHRALIGLGAEERDAIVAAIARWRGVGERSALPPTGLPHPPAGPTERALLREEIRMLASRPGHEIGAHTARHLLLPRQPRQVQLHEIGSAADALAELLGRPPRAFAYPFGAYSPETVELARAHFEFAVSCDAAVVAPGADRWRLPRLEVGDWSGEELAATLARAFCEGRRPAEEASAGR